MQIAHDITDSEREAVKRHLTSKKDRLSPKIIDKMLSKYEVSLQNKSKQITHLKMDLDDRDIAVDLFFRKKLKATEVGLLDCHEYDKLRKTMIEWGLTPANLSSIGIEALEERNYELRDFVEIHEIRYE